MKNILAIDEVLVQLAGLNACVFFGSVAQYFASTMMIVGLSVVVTVLILQFHHHDPQGGKMPRWVSKNSKQMKKISCRTMISKHGGYYC